MFGKEMWVTVREAMQSNAKLLRFCVILVLIAVLVGLRA